VKSEPIVNLSLYREEKSDEPAKRKHPTRRKRGSVFSRNGRLYVGFKYIGERVRESTGLSDTKINRETARKQLDLIIAEIENGVFQFAKRFPHSKRKDHFTELEGETITVDPKDVLFSDYIEKWWSDMRSGMSESQIRDYTSTLKTHLLPYFGRKSFSEFWSPVQLKKFVVKLKSKETRYGTTLSGKRIQNIMIPLRVIVKDAIDEYGWHNLHNPFSNLKLPKIRKTRIFPFNFKEWQKLMTFIPQWYRPYFEFAVQTGLRPSEQVALKWGVIDE